MRSDPHGIKATSSKNVAEKRRSTGPPDFPPTLSCSTTRKRLRRGRSHFEFYLSGSNCFCLWRKERRISGQNSFNTCHPTLDRSAVDPRLSASVAPFSLGGSQAFATNAAPYTPASREMAGIFPPLLVRETT